MKLMTWNVMGNCGIGARRRPKVLDIIREVGPDVVLLQEVHAAKGLPAYLADGLHDVGLNHAVWGPADPKKYGNMILSRWSVERMPRWNAVPWPQSVLRCRVEHPEQDFEAVSVHIPNGSANGWLKIETFEALAAGLSGLECPFVVGGDFNEPRTVLDDGTTIPFTMKQRADGTWHAEGSLKRNHGRFPRARWVAGVRSVLGKNAVAGIRHAAREVHGVGTVWTTHETRTSARFFDHLLASPGWSFEDAWLVEGSRGRGVSDHCAVVSQVLYTPS